MITGCVSAEILKYVQEFTDLDKFKNAFINLALPLFVFSEPDEVKKIGSKDFDPIMCGPIKSIPDPFTIWDKVVVKGPMKLKEMIEHFKQTKNVPITLVTSGKVCLYNSYLPGNKHGPRLEQEVASIYREISDDVIPTTRKYLTVDISGEVIGEGCDF